MFQPYMWAILRAPYNAAPHNHYQPHPAEPARHTTWSNTCLVLVKMGIMMPETCWESIDNKHLTVASCWFSLSLHNLLTMHGHRNLKHDSILTPKCYFCATHFTNYWFRDLDKKISIHAVTLCPVLFPVPQNIIVCLPCLLNNTISNWYCIALNVTVIGE